MNGDPEVEETLTTLKARCEELVGLVSGLGSFKTLSLEQVRSYTSRVPLLRGECVRLIEKLEEHLEVPKPFYGSRPSHSTAAINNFLAHLEGLFADELSKAASAANRASP